MFKISEATAIALHAIVYISARVKKKVPLAEIAAKFDVSTNHLSKVLQRLVKLGYLNSTKGPSGGFSATDSGKKLTLLEVYEAFEGEFQNQVCIFTSNPNSCQKCLMGDVICKIEREFIDYMSNHKVTDFKL